MKTLSKRVLPTSIAMVKFIALLVVLSNTTAFSQDLTAKAQRALQSLEEDKDSRMAHQRKISSQLLFKIKMNRGEDLTSEVSRLQVDIPLNDQGLVKVNIHAQVTQDLLTSIRSAGGQILHSSENFGRITAEIPLDRIEDIARIQEIHHIDAWLPPINNSKISELISKNLPHSGSPKTPLKLPPMLQPFGLGMIGAVTSEGDVTHQANLVRSDYNIDGSGVKIGVISDSYDQLSPGSGAVNDILNGDLPGPGNPNGYTQPVQVLSDHQGGTDEGRAMLQIIHDLVPAAELYFATAFGGEAVFAQAILDLRNSGCDVIVDDVSYLGEPVFQDGLIAQSVNTVVAGGALYFSSAGNSGNLNDGTSGVWEGDFVNGGISSEGEIHSFGAQNYNTIAADQANATIVLKWSDPYGSSANDYDMFITDASGNNVIAVSNNVQDGDDFPIEFISGNRTAGERIYIIKKIGAPNRALHLNTNRGRLGIGTAGQVFGHNAGLNTISVAATPASNVVPAGTTSGPFPAPFNASNKVELFSSDGPRRIFYNPDGMEITPGNLLFATNGGTNLQKPDITAADGVVTSFFGAPLLGNFYFFGTSAAAPHAAAIAGLIKSISPTLGAQTIKDLLFNSAIDIEDPGIDRDAGRGIIMAKSAIELLGLSLLSSNATETLHPNNNGNGFLDPGENGWVEITLENKSNIPITNIVGELQSMTPGVQIVTGNVNFPDAPAQGTTSNASNKFVFILDKTSFPCGGQIDFELMVNHNGVLSPQKYSLSGATGRIQQSLSATWPSGIASGPGFVSGAGLQFGLASVENYSPACGVPVPPLTHLYTGTLFPFQAYTFTNSSSSDQCITIKMSSTDFNLTVYNEFGLNVFDPTANQLANNDYGLPQNNILPFKVNVPAGKNFSVVVKKDNPNVVDGTPYTLDVGLAYCAEYECPEAFPITITPGSNQTFNGTVGVPFEQSFSAQGAQYAFSYSSIPEIPISGLAISGDAYTATLEGIPSAPTNGLSAFFIKAEDAHGCETDAVNLYSLKIDPCIFNTIYVNLDSFGSATVSAAEIYPGDINSSFIASTEVIPSTFTCANIGSNSVVLKITDVDGNVSECSGTIIVEDKLGPKISGPPDVMINAEPGVCGATVGDPNIVYIYGGFDNCGGYVQANLTSGIENGSFFPVGTTVCTYEATDLYGNMSTYTRTVEVLSPDDDLDGTANCADLCPAKMDVSLDFDGINDHIAVPHHTSQNVVAGDFTFSAWINRKEGSNLTIFSKGPGGGGTDYIFQIYDDKIALYLSDGSNSSWYYSSSLVPLNAWSHVAVTYRTSTDSIYFFLNGNLDAQVLDLLGSHLNADNNALYIGRQGYSCNCNFFKGQMDDVTIWNRSLSSTELKAAMAAPLAGTEPGLAAYYEFNESPACNNSNTATAIIDKSANGVHGTMANFTYNNCLSNWVEGRNLDSDNDGIGDACDVFSLCPPDYANANSLGGNQSISNDFRTDGLLQSQQVILSPAQVIYSSLISTELLPGFEVQNGALLQILTDGCNN
ncbi:MAG: S8 family serine peptidase [Saprospiraceae bacterium]|nr:S8 family serine peptidase [Saprospiraceae bacterium]